MDGNHSKSAKAEGSLTATPTSGAGTKVGLSDPVMGIRALWLNRKGKPVPPGVEAAENLAEAARTLAPLF